MFQTKVVEKSKTHILCLITFFFFENRDVNEIMWKNIVELGRSQITIWRMRIACCIPKATNTHTHTHTHTQYVIFIPFPLQQWFHERPSVVPYAYFDCLVIKRKLPVFTVR